MITWRQRATYCVGTLSYGLYLMAGVLSPCLFGHNKAIFCIYSMTTPYNISAYFIRQKETGVSVEWDNPYMLTWASDILSGLFRRDMRLSVFFNGVLCWPAVTFSVWSMYVHTHSCIHKTFWNILTLKNPTLHEIKPSLLNLTQKHVALLCPVLLFTTWTS